MKVSILLLIGISIGVVLLSGTGVMGASNSTGNNTAGNKTAGNNTKSGIGTAKEFEQLTSGNSLTNLSSLTTFDQSGSNHTSNQTK